jgi:hypothetical protein
MNKRNRKIKKESTSMKLGFIGLDLAGHVNNECTGEATSGAQP